jgi:hypothetical protein
MLLEVFCSTPICYMLCFMLIILLTEYLLFCIIRPLINLQDLKAFGTLTYASTLESHGTKLEPRGRKFIFLGYKQSVKGTIHYDLHTLRNILSLEMLFIMTTSYLINHLSLILLTGTITHCSLLPFYRHVINSYIY